ncbi:MAG TPA: protein translocase subunit SecD [Gemmatimonadaceae bacterium]|nr:protein translocase subunit SecD [Gemmatimonadaceae bacterium]
MSNLRTRILILVALIAASIFALWPRTTTIRERNSAGVFHDTSFTRVPLKLGLDLKGGMHLALEVDESKQHVANKSEAIDRALKVVRNRIDEFGVAEPVVQKVGSDRIIVELPGVTDPERARSLVERSAFLQFQITDETHALDKVMPRIDQILKSSGHTGSVSPKATPGADTGNKSAITSLFSAADSGAKKDSSAADSAKADTGLLAAASGGPFSSLIQAGQMPGEYFVADENVPTVTQYLALPAVQAALPPGKTIHWGQADEEGSGVTPLYVVDTKPIITGEYLTDAKPGTDPIEGNIVQFTLNTEGGRRFRQETSRHIGDYMAIVLDDRVMGRPPVIQSAIGTRGQITMRGQPLQKTQDLALVLRAGALPVPLKVVESRQIGASLGQDSIRDGVRAGILGVALVILIMVGYYRFSGVLAVVALSLYLLFTLAVLAGFNATLTLPGIAGLVLSVGMAVDANVLIFERIREELVRGKTVRASIDEGFKHALPAIIDSNVSTILTALVLYQFGTGPVKGFAVTLIAGICASMVSAIFVVRIFYNMWLQRSHRPQTLSI